MLGTAMIVLLGTMALYSAGRIGSASPAGLVMLLTIAALCLWQALRFWRATAMRLVLTRRALSDSAGTTVFTIDEVDQVTRNAFAFKPSNGFAVSLKGAAGNGWRPGLWWRVGRRVGVGGATPAAPTREMADLIAMMLAERKSGGA